MTLNYERSQAVKSTRMFLLSLMDPKLTPKIPRKIRQEARCLLKHYPEEFHMEVAAKSIPHIFGTDWRDNFGPK